MKPKRIRILGHEVSIVEMGEQFDDGVLGYCDTAHDEIRMKPGLSDGCWEATLLHEVVHYVSDCLSLGLTEEMVSGIGTALYSAGIRMK